MVAKNAKIAFLFPGQGSQYTGMALDLLEESPRVRALFALASDVLETGMEKLLGESDAETLKRTDVAQSAVTLANLAAAAALQDRGIVPCAVAGHSLGEYAALTIAGVISAEDCFRLVKARGRLMQEAAEQCAAGAGMAAVLGLAPEIIEQHIEAWTAGGLAGLYAANFNSPRQTVISGTAAALEEAEKRFKEAGAKRVVRLQVAGPFHSPLMEGAAERFAGEAAKVTFDTPHLPFFSNVTGGEVKSGGELQKLAVKQITAPVRWTREETALAALGIDAALETGPGAVLTGLWKDSGSATPCYPAGKRAGLESILP